MPTPTPARGLLTTSSLLALALPAAALAATTPRALEQALSELREGEGELPCTQGTQSQEQVFFVDLDQDGQSEVIVARTFYTGAGPEGTLDRLQVCGWGWDGAGLSYLEAASEELTRLGLGDAAAVEAFVSRKAAGDPGWQALSVHPQQVQSRARSYRLGSGSVRLTQTGAYFVRVTPGDQGGGYVELVGMTQADLHNAGERVWDHAGSWALREIAGEADCCSFELSAHAQGAPRITQAWQHAGSTYAVLRQEQSTVAPACQVLQISGGAIATLTTDCEGFLAERAQDPKEDEALR